MFGGVHHVLARDDPNHGVGGVGDREVAQPQL